MTTNAVSPTAVGPRAVQQSIDFVGTPMPPDGVFMRWTDRNVHVGAPIADARRFTSVTDAMTAARTLSAGSSPGVAVVDAGDGFDLHQARTYSRTYQAVSTHAGQAPYTKLIKQSNVPFAMGNLRFTGAGTEPRLDAGSVVALVDDQRVLARRA